MSSMDCFSREQLKKYVLGDLSDKDWQAIAEHLDECARCENTVSQLDSADDTLVKALRAAPEKSSESTAYRLAARRLKSQPLASSGTNSHDGTATAQFVRDYELLKPIARGGMGTVFQAVHRRLGRQVALKVLPARRLANSHDVARFQREMQAVGQLQHPAIVQATDGGEVDGIHYLVMEFVDGIDLNTLVKCVGPLSPADACELARRTAIGLAHAHDRGIIHRDVKPSNVMLTGDGEIKILDLGLARIVGEQMVTDELTTVGQLMGTLDYMAPEQFENSHQADERGDVYGLGATLFKLLTGAAPYSGPRPDSQLAKLRRIAAEPPPRLSTKRSELPNDLCEYVDRMLSRRPEDRPATMAAVAAQLEPWCAGSSLRHLIRDGLAKRAANAVDAEPVGENEANALLNMQTIASSVQPPAAIAKPGESKVDRRTQRFFRWVLALLVLGIFGVLAAVITIQTSDGQLVIETTVPDIEVRVLRAGEPFKTLTLTQTPNTLRLGSGEYEVQLVGAADGLQVQNNKFTLTRGQTVVARVVHNPEPAPAPNDPVAPQGILPPSTEPRYDGKTTLDWIADLQTDRSPSRVIAAFIALQKLGLDRASQNDVIQAVFNATQFHDEQSAADGAPSATVWKVAELTLSRFDPASVVTHASKLLDDPTYPSGFVADLLGNDAQRYRPHFSERLQSQLVRRVETTNEPQRKAAIRALANLLGTNDPRFVAHCRTWLSAENERLRLHAASYLRGNAQATPELLNAFRPLLKSNDAGIQIEALAILRDMRSDAKPIVPELIAFLEASNIPLSNERGSQVLEALGEIGDQSAVPVLIRQWQRQVELYGSKQTVDAARRAPIEAASANQFLMRSIESLTGLQFQTGRGRENGWTIDGWHLSEACLRFLSSTAASTERKTAREAIQKLLLVSSKTDVEQAVPPAIADMSVESIERGHASVLELFDLLRPAFPPKSEYRALLQAFSQPSRSLMEGFVKVGPTPRTQFIQKLLIVRAAESPEARGQIHDALANAIELEPGSELILYVDLLISLGIPDGEHSKRIAAALEKARDVEIPWKTEAVNRGLEFLRGKSKESKPSPEK